METKRLGDLVEITNGFAFKSSSYVLSGVRVVRITNVQKGHIVDESPQFYPCETKLNKYSIYEDDILMSLTGNVGRVGLFPKNFLPAYINQRICRIKPKSNKLENSFLFYFLNSDFFEHKAINNSSGVAQLNLSTKWVENFKIPLPPLPEQKKIAEILDAADSLRQKDQQLIDHYNTLSQSLFLDMFGDPFLNNKEWGIFHLDEIISSIENGWSPVCKKEKRNSEHEWAVLKLSAVTYNVYNPDKNKLLPEEFIPRSSIEVNNCDLLFTRKNTFELVGACAYVFSTEKRLMLPDTIFRLNYDITKCNPIYLWFLLKHVGFTKRIKLLATGTAGSMPNISKAKLNKLNIPLPPLKLQSQFAEQIKKIKKQKQQAQANLQKSEDLFNSLLQKAFKGELTH